MDKASLHLGRGFDDSVPAVRSVERFRGLVRDGVLSGGDKDELQLETCKRRKRMRKREWWSGVRSREGGCALRDRRVNRATSEHGEVIVEMGVSCARGEWEVRQGWRYEWRSARVATRVAEVVRFYLAPSGSF